MAAKDGERSASSATRFTATTPHASSKTGTGAATPKSRVPPRDGAGGGGRPKKPVSAAATSGGTETPEQRVARLRAAHAAAKNRQVSRFDQILAKSRPFFDSAHRITVMSLVGLTAIAGVMTAYTAYDMLRFNRQRKVEFFEAQNKMSADSLEAARLAYMRGDATDEQISQVEEANARAEGIKMPSILSAPKPLGKKKEEESGATPEGQTVAAEAEASASSSGKWSLFSFGSKKAEQGEDERQQQPPKTLEEKRAMLESARSAFEKEKENQKNGGPLDRIGTEDTATQPKAVEQPKKKGWLW